MTRQTTTLAAVSSTGGGRSSGGDPVVAAVTGALAKMKTVLPSHITAEKMARLAMGELRTNKQLATIASRNPASLVSALMKASQAGLEIGGTKGHGYLVPYGAEITFLPGYRGLIQLARQSGQVTSISVHIVYEQDKFEMTLGIDEKIAHTPLLGDDRGEPVLVYGVARFTDGSHHFDWMSIKEVEKIAAATQSKGKSGPWAQHRGEMIRKTMIRRLVKYLPMSSDRLEAAVTASDAFDAGQTIDIDATDVSDVADRGEGGQADNVDQSTGEISGSGREQGGAPRLTFAEVQHSLVNAKTLDDLDETAALIQNVGNTTQQKELRDSYLERKSALGGEV